MPAIRRTARSCALSIISLGVVATGSLGVSLAAAPAQAADRDAVALDEGQYAEVKKRDAKLRDSAQRKEASRLETAVSVALNQRGDAYVYGAMGENAFDCSGLTMRAWAQAGVSLPHSSSAQFGSGPRVAASDLQPGDLVFYYSPISHVGMYIGNGMIVHAANPGAGVVVSPVNSMPYSGAVRPG